MRWLIVTPDYTDGSGGIVALHRLCHLLNVVGEKAAVTGYDGAPIATSPDWLAPTEDADPDTETVVVYPEGFSANVFGGRRVVRWLLNRPYWSINHAESDGHLVVAYSPAIDPTVACFHLPVIDPDIFYPPPPGAARAGQLLWGGKRTAHPTIDLSAATEIHRHWPATKRALADLLRSADVLYSLDTLSAVNTEAALCATPVMLFPDQTWPRQRMLLDPNLAGIGWVDHDTVENVRCSATTAHDDYRKRWDASIDTVAGFVETCAARWET